MKQFGWASAKAQIGDATQSEDGLMSSTDKTKLDGIDTGANKTTVSDSLTDTSTTNALSAAKGKALNEKNMFPVKNLSDMNSDVTSNTSFVAFTAVNPTHRPTGTSVLFGFIIRYDANNYAQIALTSGGGIYTRHCSFGTWGGWFKASTSQVAYA